MVLSLDKTPSAPESALNEDGFGSVGKRIKPVLSAVGHWAVQTLSQEAGQNRLTPLRAIPSDAVNLPSSEGLPREQTVKAAV